MLNGNNTLLKDKLVFFFHLVWVMLLSWLFSTDDRYSKPKGHLFLTSHMTPNSSKVLQIWLSSCLAYPSSGHHWAPFGTRSTQKRPLALALLPDRYWKWAVKPHPLAETSQILTRNELPAKFKTLRCLALVLPAQPDSSANGNSGKGTNDKSSNCPWCWTKKLWISQSKPRTSSHHHLTAMRIK